MKRDPVVPDEGAYRVAAVVCSVPDCRGADQITRGLCRSHYNAAYRRGTLPPKLTREQRFWQKVDRSGACWIWTGYVDQFGYGRIHRGYAHRFAYETVEGPIPANLVLDHLCRVPACVNPRHLEAVPQRLNVLRGESPAAHQARQTHCKRGHELTSENTSLFRGKRRCRTCYNARRRRAAA